MATGAPVLRAILRTSSVDFARAYDRVASHLEARGFPLAVVGGLGLHAYGITRLNVYAGEAAGYAITDAVEQDLINGTNVSGVNIANIDNLGNVHPDTMWWHHTLGNVRERPFSSIWPDTSDPLMAGLKQHPRPVQGRCARCTHLAICNGNTRVRAQQLTGNAWAEDPACYLTDDEIGAVSAPRLRIIPYHTRQPA